MNRTPGLIRLLLLPLTGLILSGCSDPSPQQLKKGDELYSYYCRNCHEVKGLGPFLEQLPLTASSLKQHEVVLMIKHGYPQGHEAMPVFTQLSHEQADAVARFILQQRYRRPIQPN
ncbi:c-type cytochrome [Marinobacterium sediminicola]|uniref:Cytochrome C oxidase, cbb3-type, subunit III n=1 Tax=Marinobacterium sediminicola TaxID=518898 RepID=A0ABY1S0D5_9GAMM|nr:cytochrome c [Marinobacterium sediminicola]ULG69644.1 cytochrome c [Marinobacterium sediminicola]SMR74628.1 Cytochrome C oxidase, cbb3-type, subunit III [Marinobacterium sediminicola]